MVHHVGRRVEDDPALQRARLKARRAIGATLPAPRATPHLAGPQPRPPAAASLGAAPAPLRLLAREVGLRHPQPRHGRGARALGWNRGLLAATTASCGRPASGSWRPTRRQRPWPGSCHSTVSVDARPLDIENLRAQGIGRYAHGLLGPLVELAAERGAELTLIRQGSRTPKPVRPGGGQAARACAGRRCRPARSSWSSRRCCRSTSRGSARTCTTRCRSTARPLVSRAAAGGDDARRGAAPVARALPATGVAHRMLYRAVRRAAAVLCASRAAARDVAAPARSRPGARDRGARRGRRRTSGPPTPARSAGGSGSRARTCSTWAAWRATTRARTSTGLIDAFAGWAARRGPPRDAGARRDGGPVTRELEAHAGRLGARVLFAGFVPDAELPALYLRRRAAWSPPAATRASGCPRWRRSPAARRWPPTTPARSPRPPARARCWRRPGDGAGADARRRADLRRARAGRAPVRPRAAATRPAFSWRRTAELTWEVYESVATVPRP